MTRAYRPPEFRRNGFHIVATDFNPWVGKSGKFEKFEKFEKLEKSEKSEKLEKLFPPSESLEEDSEASEELLLAKRFWKGDASAYNGWCMGGFVFAVLRVPETGDSEGE